MVTPKHREKRMEPKVPIAFENILLATDFTPASERALPYALAMARHYNSHLHLVHVISPELSAMLSADAMAVEFDMAQKCALEEMARLAGQLEGVDHEELVRKGTIWGALSEVIKSKNIDLVVTGTHGRKGLGKLVMGSIAQDIFLRSPVPVLIVGPGAIENPPAQGNFKRILVSCGKSAESCTGPNLDLAFSLAQENQARITLLHIVEDGHAPGPEEAFQRLRKLIPGGADLWCEPEILVKTGKVTEQILVAADERDADLIVIGGGRPAAHMPGITHLPGSTPDLVASRARCPVLRAH